MDIQSLVLDVKEYTEHRMERYIEELRELCSIYSYSYHKPGLDEMAKWLAARMRGLGMEANMIKREQWGNDLLGTMQGEDTGVVVLLGHSDTIYSAATEKARPLRVEDNKAYGAGAADAKGGLLSALYAIEAMKAMNYHHFSEIRFLCVSDMEIPDQHSSDIMQQVCQGSNAVLCLEEGRPNGDLVSARKGHAVYTLKAQGKATHAGVEPEKGHNAIMEIAHQTIHFQSLNGWREGVTVNPGAISGGGDINIVPDSAESHFDLRFLHPEDRTATEEHWREMMQEHLIPGIELTLECSPRYRLPMVCTPETLRLVHQAQGIARVLGGQVGHTLTGSSSDANQAAQYGASVLDGLGPVGGSSHSLGEYVQLDSVAPRTAMLAGLIASVGTK